MELGHLVSAGDMGSLGTGPRHLLGETQAGSGVFRGCFKLRSGGGAGVLSRQPILSPMVKMVYLITAVYDAAVYASIEPFFSNRTLF